MRWVCGLDLSLTGAGVVMLPVDWKDVDWSRCQHFRCGYVLMKAATAYERAKRLDAIAREIVDFVMSVDTLVSPYVEGYGFQAAFNNGPALGELGGVVKVEFFRRLDVVPEPVVISQGRKLLLGVNGKDARKQVLALTTMLKAPFNTQDEADAFAVANVGLQRQGGTPLAMPPPEGVASPRGKARKGRKAAGVRPGSSGEGA